MKYFFICDYISCKLKTYKDMRLFCEDIFMICGYSIIDYFIRLNVNGKTITKGYKYIGDRKSKFDEYPLEAIQFISFGCSRHCDEKVDEEVCNIAISTYNGNNTITLVYCSDTTITLEIIHSLLYRISEILTIKYFCFDKLEKNKRVELFVQGVMNEQVRSALENNIAHSIQLSSLIHHKLPFLFLYTYFNPDSPELIQNEAHISKISEKYYQIFFPENVNIDFSEYKFNESWNNIYKKLTHSGELKFGK